ncbi:MAG: hypothetical protein FWC73_02520 [Defluviitaleaceae bacterium]|nr:hypothetical protein [Defluviitaleaceae bacterium]
MLNKVQEKSYKLIQADARFVYTLTRILRSPNAPKSNYIMMLQPFIGLFADGSEQWGRKVGIDTPVFTEKEKNHYTEMRNSIKLFDMNYDELFNKLRNALNESDKYFYDTRTLRSKLSGLYYNAGVDLQGNTFCGNTILCSLYTPFYKFSDEQYGTYIKDTSIVAGKLAAVYGGNSTLPYHVNGNLTFRYEDYHFFSACPRDINSYDDFILFSILCSVNFIRVFINQYFVDEFPTKLRFAYLQYYYLTTLIPQMNQKLATNFTINLQYKNDKFRNCMAHYGLGVALKETDIIESDMFFGLSNQLLDMSYTEIKTAIYSELDLFSEQLTEHLLA